MASTTTVAPTQAETTAAPTQTQASSGSQSGSTGTAAPYSTAAPTQAKLAASQTSDSKILTPTLITLFGIIFTFVLGAQLQ